MHKAGFVNIVGKPNVGKSTLMNALMGENLSITTNKPQTTRHRIKGIISGEDFQIVFSDTPGIIKPRYLLQNKMMESVETAFTDADVILIVTDVKEDFSDVVLINKLNKTEIPKILLINKIDLSNEEKIKELREAWQARLKLDSIIPVSVKNNFNVDKVMDEVLEKLPESPAYFPKDQLTDLSERFFVSEFIREKIFLNYKKEIPYSVEVIIDSFKEEKDIFKISSTIFVERDSQKGIVIGHKGQSLKKVGTSARIEIEKFLQKKVYLELHVKVRENWRNDERHLKNFGYSG